MKVPIVLSRGYAMRRAPGALGVRPGVQTAPARPRPKTIVVLGSSNAAGMGASGYAGDPVGPTWSAPALSWVGRLKTLLGGSWSVINRSISGSGTQASIDRFWSDCAPHAPSHVVLATALHNDSYDVRGWLQRTRQLIQMVRSIGAVPVVRGPSPYNAASASQIAAMFDAQRMMEGLGVPLLDALSTLSDPAAPGKFSGGAAYHSGDGLHPNDAGNGAQISAVDLDIFRFAAAGTPATKPPGTWKLADATDGANAMVLDLASGLSREVESFTMRARIGGLASGVGFPGNGLARAFLAAQIYGAAAPLRVRNPSGPVELTNAGATDGVPSAISMHNSLAVRDVVIVFRAVGTGGVTTAGFYMDGASVGSFAVTATQPCGRFLWGSRETGYAAAAGGYRYSDCQLWRVPLPSEAIADMARSGYAPRAGMIFDGTFWGRPGPVGAAVGNNVPSGAAAQLGQVWEAAPGI